MRAIKISKHGDPDVLSVTETETPEPDTGEIRIDVRAAGVNFADLAKRRGEYPGGPSPPYIPGIEVSGRVESTGPETSVLEDDRVMAYVPTGGGYAESVVADTQTVFPVPPELSLQEAAAVPIQWVTAHNVLFEWGDLTADDRLLVLAAAGGVGSAAVQLGAVTGATVLGAAGTAEKCEFVSNLGADHTIEYTSTDLGDAIGEYTDGTGVDLVLDGVGGDAFRAALNQLAPGGTIVTYGIASGDVPSVSTPRLLFGNHSVRGYHLGHATKHEPERVLGAIDPLCEQLASGTVSVQLDRTFALENAEIAHEYVADRQTTGKVLLEP